MPRRHLLADDGALLILDRPLADALLSFDALVAAGIVSVHQGDLTSALAFLLRLTAVRPEDADAWADVATLAEATGDAELAALGLGPPSPPAPGLTRTRATRAVRPAVHAAGSRPY